MADVKISNLPAHIGALAADDLLPMVNTGSVVTEKATLAQVQTFLTADITATGICYGGILTINGDNTLFDLSAGCGVIVDKFTDPAVPTYTIITWSAQIGVTVDNIGATNVSYAYWDSAGILQQVTTELSLDQETSNISIGALFHPDLATLNSVSDKTHSMGDGYLIHALATALGGINTSGNNYNEAGTDLTIRKEAGSTFREQVNRAVNPRDPHNKTSGVVNPVTFFTIYSDFAGDGVLGAATSNIDPNMWNDAGTLSAISGTNRWQIQTLYFFPQTGVHIVRYGEEIFTSFASAEGGLATLSQEFVDGLSDVFVRTTLIVKKGETDLSSSDTLFTATGKNGLGTGGGGGAGGTFQDLQDVYNNSVTPQITTDSTGGAFAVKRGSAADTDNVYEGQNGSGTNTFEVTGEGDVDLAGDLGVGGDGSVTGDLAIGIASVTDFGGTRLQIHGSAARIKLTTTTSGTGTSDGASIVLDSSNNLEITNRESGDVRFLTAGVVRLTAEAAGNIDIANDLTVGGGELKLTAALNTIHTGTSDGSDNAEIFIASGGGTGNNRGAYLRLTGNESSGQGDLSYYTGKVAGDHSFYTDAGSLRMSITKAGDVDIANDLSVNGFDLTPERGSFTPSVGGTATYSVQEGKYTKIGNLVHIHGKMIITTIGTGSVSTVSDLPFTVDGTANVATSKGELGFYSNLATAFVRIVPTTEKSTTTFKFSTSTAATTSMSAGATIFVSGSRIDFSITYIATA